RTPGRDEGSRGDLDEAAQSEVPARDPATRDRRATTVARFVDSTGRPVSGATLVIAREGPKVEAWETDAEGRVRLEGDGEVVRVCVLRPTSMPFRAHVALDGREHRLEIPRGREVSGRVRVDGRVPDRPVRLSLEFD